MVTLHLPIDAPDFYPNKPATRLRPTRPAPPPDPAEIPKGYGRSKRHEAGNGGHLPRKTYRLLGSLYSELLAPRDSPLENFL